jgi:F0F1-type ATP synthase membrane subunit b/b'
MCYEKWDESKQVTETLEKARKEADRAIEKAKSAARPERRPETEPRPAVESEETAA